MSRYIREVVINKPDDFVQYIMNDFLTKHGFKLEQFKGQQVYRAGGGMIEIPKFLVWGYQNGVFHIEAWTRTLWLPGVYGGENDLSGFAGAVPKSAYKNDIEQLIGLLFQSIDQGQPNPAMAGQPMGQGMPQQTVYVRGTDTSRYATMGLVFSLIGILGICMPIVGVIFGALGITYGKKGQTSEKKGMATAGFVIGIIVLVVSIIMWILNIVAMAL